MVSHNPADIEAEFYIDGAWVSTYSGYDLTHRVRGGNGEGSIRISRGVSDYQAGVSAQTAQYTLNNSDGLFTDDNPDSPLYHKFGQNTRVRFGVKDGNGTWEEYLRMPDYDLEAASQYAYTVDKASLDITGDIDIRVEFSPAYTRGREMLLASKWGVGGQGSWALYLRPEGAFRLWTSPDGTVGNALFNTTIPVIDEDTARIAVRVTVDVNDGAGNRVYSYYTSDSITGTWTLFASGTIAGTTTLFSSTANLEIGTGGGGGRIFNTSSTFTGKIHAMELYSGIAGTKVADFKPVGKGLETTTWADTCASPNTWILSGTEVRLASDRIRYAGENISTPLDWDKTGNDVFCFMSAAGLLSRYSANKGPLRGTIYRSYRLNTNLTDYWPCEDADSSTQVSSAVAGGRAGKIFDATFGTPEGIAGSTGCLTLNTAGTSFAKFQSGTVPTGSTATTGFFYFRLAALPASDQTFATLYVVKGTAVRVVFKVGATGFNFSLIDSSGTTLDSGGVLFGTDANPLNQWVAMAIRLTQEGGNVRWETTWHAVGSSNFYTHVAGGSTFAGTAGQFNKIYFTPTDANFASAQICHVILMHDSSGGLFGSSNFAEISRGWSGEKFGDRCKRLLLEEGVFFQWRGDLSDTAAVGPQRPDTVYSILTSGQKVAGGILAEPRDVIGVELITQRYLGNRRGLELDYSQSHIQDVPTPVNDTRFLVNDFTASRDGGGSARYEANDGRRKNVNDPPTGIGRWELADSFNAETDDSLLDIASQQVFLGTWDERRIPNLNVALHRSQIAGTSALLRRVIATDLGDPVNLTGLTASPLPPNDLLMLIFGYTEMISNKTWSLVLNTVPAGPYQVPILDDYAGRYPRMDVDDDTHSVLKSSLNTTATSFVVKTDAASTRRVTKWVDATNFPNEIGGGNTIDIDIDGERITVSSIGTATLTGGFNEQTFTISARSVNTIVKSHSAGATVKLWSPFYLGRE